MKRILLVIDTETAVGDVLLPASVLTAWLGASLKVVCDHRRIGAGCERIADGLGVPVDPVVTAVGSIGSAAVGLAREIEPTLIVADSPRLGRRLAVETGRPVLVVAPDIGRRLPAGPIEVPVAGAPSDLDSVALAAVMAPALGRPVALRPAGPVVATHLAADIDALAARLTDAGCDLIPAAAGRPGGAAPTADKDGHGAVGRGGGEQAGPGEPLAVVVPAVDHDWFSTVAATLDGGTCVLLAPGSAPPPVSGPGSGPAPTAVTGPASDAGFAGRPGGPAGLSARLETLDHGACVDHLARHTLGRIGYVVDGRPMIVPTNYRFVDGVVYLRSMDGAKADLAAGAAPVCLEIDGYDEGLRCGWSVTAQGPLETVDDPTVLRSAWRNDPEPWVMAERWHWLRIVPEHIDGRQVEPGVV